MVSLVTEQLSDIRSNQVNEFQEIFKKCETMEIPCIKGIFLIPSNLENINAEVNKVKEAYSSDLPSPNEFEQEINLWKRSWSSKNPETIATITSTRDYIMERNIQQRFPSITRILSILMTTSATSATVETANSTLRSIKTDFRNTMLQDRFNALMLTYVHRDISLNTTIL